MTDRRTIILSKPRQPWSVPITGKYLRDEYAGPKGDEGMGRIVIRTDFGVTYMGWEIKNDD